MIITEPVGETWKYNQDYHRLANFIGLNDQQKGDFRNAQKVAAIRDYFHKAKTEPEALEQIYKFQKQLGINTQGETLLNQLYQHVRLKQDTVKPTRTETKKTEPKVEKKDEMKDVIEAVANKVASKIRKEMAKTEAPEAKAEVKAEVKPSVSLMDFALGDK